MAHQGARVDLGQHRNRVPLHVLIGDLFGAPVGTDLRELANDQALDIGLGRFVVSLVGAVVSDLGIGENDDLTGIGRIGGDFLVTGKGSIKNDLTLAFARMSIAEALEDAPVFERKNCMHRLSEEWIQSILAGFVSEVRAASDAGRPGLWETAGLIQRLPRPG